MPFVVDASIAAAWMLPDEQHSAADAARRLIRHDEGAAPVQWWFEIRNVLIVNERRGRMSPAQTDRALDLLARLPIQLDRQPKEDGILRLARGHKLSVYDAAYLELALRLHAPLATLDTELAQAAQAENVPLIGDAGRADTA